MDIEIVRRIGTIKRWKTVTIELNMVRWNGGDIKYDIRKWNNGEPMKGISLEQEDMKSLYNLLFEEFGTEKMGRVFSDVEMDDDMPFQESLVQTEELMDYRKFMIYGNFSDCEIECHEYNDINVQVSYFTHGKVKKIGIPARYCRTCNAYYISEKEFQKLERNGKILCKVVSKKDYDEYMREAQFGKLSPQSILKAVGYSVNSVDDFSDEYR